MPALPRAHRRPLLALLPLTVLLLRCGAAEHPPSPPAPLDSKADAEAPDAAPTAVAPSLPPAPPVPEGIEVASLDPATAPCGDFFQYACGGWIKENPIPEDQAGWSRFAILGEENEKALRAILEKDAKAPDPKEAYAAQLGAFYASCMDEARVEALDAKALAPELARIDAVKDGASLAKTLAHLRSVEVNAFFDFGSQQDFKDATLVIGGVGQAGLGMPDRDYYLKDDDRTKAVRASYAAHVTRTFALLSEAPKAAEGDTAAVMRIEHALALASLPKVHLRDPLKIYHRLERDGLAKLSPALPWNAYFAELGTPNFKPLNVAEPEFFGALNGLLEDELKAPAGVRAYLRWQLTSRYAPRLSQRFVDEDFSFQKELTGAAKVLPRWKRCVRAADAAMGEALAQPFVKTHLGDEGRAEARQMIGAIEGAMKANLSALAWMDDETRAPALAKLAKIDNHVGYPDRWRRYDGLAMDKGAYAANSMRAAAFETRRDLAKIGKPVDRGEWGMTPPTVNAYYDPSLNQMVFPAGILEPPFFSKAFPLAVNFGAVGMVMGHELTHGFDDEGRQFDGDGNLRDWWSTKTSAEFDARAACVATQFDGYVPVDDLHVNGKLTLGEDIADLGGLKVSHTAMLAAAPVAAPGAAPASADEEDLTRERAFFLGYAQGWCSDMRDAMKRVRVRTDPHAPPKFRVNGPLSNMEEFARAFSCPVGAPMVRGSRCAVW